MDRKAAKQEPTQERPVQEDGEISLARIKQLLVGAELARLEQLAERVEHPEQLAREVARVLPHAVDESAHESPELARALMPPVQEAIRRSVRKDPKPLVDALLPVMGPAIRGAIASIIKRMVQSLNRTLEHSFSLRGLKWRIESVVTGKPFAEIVFLHSLAYKVEQLFLIHKESSLLLCHLSAEGEFMVQDGDMVSSMLAAIKDFVRDSFEPGKELALETVQAGDLHVWIEDGPSAILAAVIRGTAPNELREQMQAGLERVHLQMGGALAEFCGDTAPFTRCHSLLEECLVTETQEKKGLSWVTWVLMVLPLLFVGWLGVNKMQQVRAWNSYVQRLDKEPGLVVTKEGVHWGGFRLQGLRDPLAAMPQSLSGDLPLRMEQVTMKWVPFYSLEQEIVLRRAHQVLQPPPSLKLSLDGGLLLAEGVASLAWRDRARSHWYAVAGVRGFREAQLTLDELVQLRQELERLNGIEIQFEVGASTLTLEQLEVLDGFLVRLGRAAQLAQTLDGTVTLSIAGHTDESGSEVLNSRLRKQRAEVILSHIDRQFKGVSRLRCLVVDPRTAGDGQSPLLGKRSVSFFADFGDP